MGATNAHPPRICTMGRSHPIVWRMDESLDPLDTAWERVEGSWTDDELHRKFLALCETLGRLDEAGRRYRAVRDTDPSRRESAETRIDQLLTRAMSSLELTRSEPSARPRRILNFFAAFVAVGLLATALYFWLG